MTTSTQLLSPRVNSQKRPACFGCGLRFGDMRAFRLHVVGSRCCTEYALLVERGLRRVGPDYWVCETRDPKKPHYSIKPK